MPNRSNLGKVDRSAPTGGLSAEIGDWSAGPGPLYRLLATAVGRAVERGAQVHAGGARRGVLRHGNLAPQARIEQLELYADHAAPERAAR